MNLYKLNDMLNENFIRLPMAIIANPKYRGLSSDAKILYSLLRNRLQLSQHNNWVNEKGEVYLIYTREQAADTLGISYKTVIKTFKELIEIGLLFEERRGKSLANHIYLSKAEECKLNQTTDFNEVFDKPFGQTEPATQHQVTCKNDISQEPEDELQREIPASDMKNLHIKNCKKDISGYVKSTVPDMSFLQPNNKEFKNKDLSYIENKSVSQSCERTSMLSRNACNEFLTDRLTLENILDNCEFEIFDDDIANIYKSAVERLYYSETFKVGNAVMPNETLRRYLTRLNTDMLASVHDTLCKNTARIKNPIAYVMSMIINAVCECNIEMYAYSAGVFPTPCKERMRI